MMTDSPCGAVHDSPLTAMQTAGLSIDQQVGRLRLNTLKNDINQEARVFEAENVL
jgi:hypothetical protein